jgi:lipopolysaccharide transport system permease protein
MVIPDSTAALNHTSQTQKGPQTLSSLQAEHVLPEEPIVVLRPGSSWAPIHLSDLWAYRELLFFLIWRDLKVRYKQTVFGVAWVVLQPVLMTIIFTVFLGRFIRVPSGGLPYSLMVFSGLLPWTFFSTAVLSAVPSLVGNSALITKVYFPRILIPAANVAARLVDFLISFSILVMLMLYFRFVRDYPIQLTWNLLILVLMIVLLIVFTLSVSILLSSLNVQYRDVGVALPVLMQLWMFASPIIYSQAVVPEGWRTLYSLNPLVGLVEGFRASLLGGEIPWVGLAITSIITLGVLISAAIVFRRTEEIIADVV